MRSCRGKAGLQGLAQGMQGAEVSKLSRRFRQKIEGDQRIRKLMKEVQKKLDMLIVETCNTSKLQADRLPSKQDVEEKLTNDR